MLPKCPHMMARCPHYRKDCEPPKGKSKACHYVKNTTASMISVIRNLKAIDIEKLPPVLRIRLKNSLEEAEEFLED